MDEKILGGDTAPKGTLPGKEKDTTEPGDAAAATADMNADIAYVTGRGGLTALPKNYPEKNGYWKSILSDNPFEVLYLDFKQYATITPDTVQRNFDVLSAFWRNTLTAMNSNREKIKSRYGGEETVNNAEKKLQDAYNRLKTSAGIQAYFKEADGKRYQNGIKAIQGLVNIALADGEFTRQEANTVIAEALKNALNEVEVRNHLHQTLLAENFKPRAAKTYPDVFDNHWMTDERWNYVQSRSRPEIKVNGVAVSSLEELGEVLFNNREFAGNYLKNANYLPQDVSKLETSDKAMAFEEIINKEADAERRYLKLIYRLNNTLPFRIENDTFKQINVIFNRTRQDYPLFLRASSSYEKGHIHIWLKESDPVNAAKLTTGFNYNSFLTFLYSVDNRHPFYLKTERFETPEQLADQAVKDKSLWNKIAEAMANGQLPAWFAGTGKRHWIEAYNTETEVFIESKYHDADEKKMAAVQTLIQIIHPAVPLPKIISASKNIRLLSVEGSSTLQHPIILKLENQGFVKARIFFDKAVEGITLDKDIVSFHSQAGNTEQKVMVIINALHLTKNKLYAANILISAAYETITLPLEVKVVFPRKAYFFHLLKYALFGAIFFGAMRYVLGTLTGYASWLGAQSIFIDYPSFGTSAYNLPDNYFLFFIALLILIAGLLMSFFLIRKKEKI